MSEVSDAMVNAALDAWHGFTMPASAAYMAEERETMRAAIEAALTATRPTGRGAELRKHLLGAFGTDYGMTDEQLEEFANRAVEASLLMRRSWRAVAIEIVRAAVGGVR